MYDIDQFNNLRQSILDKLVNETTTIAESYFELRSEFTGSPVAVVDISSNEALYHSTHNDRLTFVFQIRIYIPLKDDSDAHEVEINMGKSYWEVLNLFSKRGALGGLVAFVEPIPSTWGYLEIGSGVYRYSEINVRCVTLNANR